MAVFSEPSTAVSRALEIQEVLRRYSAQHSDQPPILVRIGLHMGQVTVEDKVTQMALLPKPAAPEAPADKEKEKEDD